MSYSYYITPDEYDIAEANGVKKSTLDQRVRDLAWNKKKAIETPPRSQKSIKQWVELARQNRISYQALQMRINKYKWKPERAATQPLINRKENMVKVAKSRRKYPKEVLDRAKANGISYDTFRQRLYNGWKLEDAMTRPTMNREEITRIKINKYLCATRELRDKYDAGAGK